VPYTEDYIKLLSKISEGEVTYEDIDSDTPEGTTYREILLEGVKTNREYQEMHRVVPSSQLSMHRVADHLKSKMIKTISLLYLSLFSTSPPTYNPQASHANSTCRLEVLIMMCKGNPDDIFNPVVWATSKAQQYWNMVAGEDLKLHATIMEGYAISAARGKQPYIKTWSDK
jgi:hypothetical protein